MSYTFFLQSVHQYQPYISAPHHRQRAPHQLIVPVAVRGSPLNTASLKAQKETAVVDQVSFNHAIRYLSPDEKPYHPISLCPQAHKEGRCLDNIFCKHAGNLAVLYAHNIKYNPFYKTRPCKFQHCKLGYDCQFGHQGDLMRRIRVVGRQVFTKGWYILNG